MKKVMKISLVVVCFFSSPALGQYCSASGGGEQYISGVIVGNLVNIGTGNDGYVDYTSISTTVALGESQIATIINGLSITGSQCRIWIDWNADSDFDDAGETIVMSGGPASFTGTITAPTAPGGTTAGDKRMRVRIMGTGSLTACGDTTYGEVEDYTITVVAPWTGSGDANDPYQVWTPADMQAIGASSGYWGAHFELMADDIDLSGYTGTSFNIIGILVSSGDPGNKPFTGVFDGNGHTISNFTYTSTGTGNIGLFRYVDDPGAEIKDLGLINPNINAGTGNKVGSLVGQIVEGSITKCYAEAGSVSGDSSVGGLVGYNQYGVITNCSSTGSVSGTGGYVGGLVGIDKGTIRDSYSAGSVSVSGSYVRGVGGLAGQGGDIVNCYSSANVSASGSDVRNTGGLVGQDGNIANCYSTGSVSGVDNVGGLMGWNRGITNSYSTGSVSGTGTDVGGLVGYNNGLVSACFWDIQTSGRSNMCGGQIGSASGCDDGNGKTTAQMQDINTFLAAGWDFVGEFENGPSDNWAQPPGGGYMVLWWQLPENELPALTFSGGAGTESDPYLISNATDLNRIGHNGRLMAAHFRLINDIDLGGVDFFCIGGRGYNYSGVFNGNGHTISNFTYSSTGTDNSGLFGAIAGEDAEVKDLGLIDPDVNAGTGSVVGSLVGRNSGTITNCYVDGAGVAGTGGVGGLVGSNTGTITDCHSSGIVVSTGYGAGGLVGLNYTAGSAIMNCYSTGRVWGYLAVGGLAGGSVGTVTNSYATGNVSGESYVGGLVGSGWGTISNCYSTGSVSGVGIVGGLVGENGGTITNCYSTGSVSGSDCGGLVGWNDGTINNCYATGPVSGTSDVGGLCGYNYNGIYIKSFWDTTVNTALTGIGNTSDPNVIGASTTNLQTESPYVDSGWDFVDESTNGTNDIWRMCADGINYAHLFHQYNVNGDFACPDGVGIDDVFSLSNNWLNSEELDPGFNYPCDPTFDGVTNLFDFVILSEHWLEE